MKQTAVEFLISKIESNSNPSLTQKQLKESIEQAKQMEKQQVINAHLTGLIHPLEMEATKQAEQYYNKTFKK